MNAKWLTVGVLCLLLATACGENRPTGPTEPLDRLFTLAPGQAAPVDGSAMRIRFLGVSGDSRCPADALCIQGGDALVHITVENRQTTEHELHTGDSSRAVVWHSDVRIELANLQPYPFSSRTIRPDEYRATLKVSR